jgi:AraC-like DNA-binding protein
MTVTEPIVASADPLGEALHSLRMSGTFYCRSELTEPWGVTLPAMAGCVWFHVVTSGHCLLEVGDAEHLLLRPGELALVPHGRGHRARSEAGVAVPDVLDLPHDYVSDRYAVLHHGGGGAPSTVICGAVRFDHPAARDLLELLPALIHVDASDSPQSDWMHATLRLIAAEATSLRPGGETITTRLSDVLVIQAIRSWIDNDPAARSGWLGALKDPQIGRAISLIHRQPARAWTVAALAGEVVMSRSAFAARFTELVGQPAMSYLTRWRMHLADDWLRRNDTTVGTVAAHLGYQSEAAFSRAFKRINGIPPGTAQKRANTTVSNWPTAT